MGPEIKLSNRRDSFLDVLRSEIIAGSENLTAWINHIQDRGAIDSLFGLETWLKGIRAFFQLEHAPLSESEKTNLLDRNFAPELRIVHQAIQVSEAYACAVMQKNNVDMLEFEEFIEAQMRKARILDFHVSCIVEQRTPWDSVSQLLESLNDLRVTIDALENQRHLDYQLFFSLGRCFRRELQSCRYMNMLISQRFRLQYDHIDDKNLTSILRSITEDPVRRNVALALLYLFRFLRYLTIVSDDLNQDRPLRRHLMIFSLLHEEMGSLSDFLKAHFVKAREARPPLRNAAGLIAYSLAIESQRVMSRELVAVSVAREPSSIYAKIENSHGLLRNCCQNCILTLVQAIDNTFDATALFPSRTDHLMAAQKLRQDLWEMRQWLSDILHNREDLDTVKIIERLTSFKESSLRSLMYRDWQEFDSFLDAMTTTNSFIEIRTRMRKFVSFLEALVQEVSKRSIFQNGSASR